MKIKWTFSIIVNSDKNAVENILICFHAFIIAKGMH